MLKVLTFYCDFCEYFFFFFVQRFIVIFCEYFFFFVQRCVEVFPSYSMGERRNARRKQPGVEAAEL